MESIYLRLFFFVFGVLSCVCCGAEFYEIAYDVNIYWSDHLHNLLDHVVFIVVNYIGLKMYYPKTAL